MRERERERERENENIKYLDHTEIIFFFVIR